MFGYLNLFMMDKTNNIMTTTAKCTPFLPVPDITQTIKWYENIGFKCIGTNHIWEPDCGLNWAELDWKGASFMIGPDIRNSISEIKDASLWFNVDSVDEIIKLLKEKGETMEIEPETFFGLKVVSFKDLNGFHISFSCEPDKK